MGRFIDWATGSVYRLVWLAGWWVGHRQGQAISRINREDQS